MKIDLNEAIYLLRVKIPKRFTVDPKSKFLIQYLDNKGNLAFATYLIINEARFPSLVDLGNFDLAIKIDTAHHLSIMKNNVYAIDPDRMKMFHTRNSLNFKRSDNFKHLLHADPETKTLHKFKGDRNLSEVYTKFDYWGHTKFQVIISLKPTDIDELLAPDGVLIDLSEYNK